MSARIGTLLSVFIFVLEEISWTYNSGNRYSHEEDEGVPDLAKGTTQGDKLCEHSPGALPFTMTVTCVHIRTGTIIALLGHDVGVQQQLQAVAQALST